jgi:hypothetical protein
MDTRADLPELAWWRVRMVWLVIAGPAIVVSAGVVTTVLAVRGADTVVSARPPTPSQAPALQARNHAAAPKQ